MFRCQTFGIRAGILPIFGAIASLSAGVASGADSEWSGDFSADALGAEWNFNTNSPVVTFNHVPGFGTSLAGIEVGGNTIFHSAAIHQNSYGVAVGDSLTVSLAWSPSFAQEVEVGGYNQMFQLGVLNLSDSWASATDTFASGDGIWLAGREVAATAPTGIGEWGTSTFDLWIHTDDANTANPLTSEYLGRQTIDTFKQGSDGSISMKFLDIDLVFGMENDGEFEFGVGIDQWEFTSLAGATEWVDEGEFVNYSGSRTHDLDDTSALHPSLGYIVADSSSQGVQSAFFSQAPLAVPEPSGLGLLGLGVSLLLRRRRA